jgi:phytoene/squalene synthetase
MTARDRDRLVDWSIVTLLGTAIWLLSIHVLVWAARTFGLAAAALGLAAIALVGLVLALVGVWRDLREARKPWRESSWIEREALR